jgi:hypothetical protein
MLNLFYLYWMILDHFKLFFVEVYAISAISYWSSVKARPFTRAIFAAILVAIFSFWRI